MNTHVQHKTIYNRLGQIAVVALVAFGIAGCYWTQPEPSGQLGVTIEAAEVTGSSEIGASATLEELDGLITLFVFSERVMNQGEQAFNEVATELSSTLESTYGGSDPTGELEQTTFTAETDGAQVVWKLFDSSQGTSGSITFTDLEVGEEYFVFAGGGTNGQEGQYVGFDTATIGTTNTVTLRLQSDFSEFESFLQEYYGFASEAITITPVAATDGMIESVPLQLYYDVIDASSGSINMANHKVQYSLDPVQYFVSDTNEVLQNDFSLAQRLTQVTYIATDGSSIDGSSGTRPEIPGDYMVSGLEYGQEVQLVVTNISERGMDFTQEGLGNIIGITEPFTVGVDETPFVELYEWASGF